MNVCKHKQQGIGLTAIILIIAGFLFVAILSMKVVPAYLHNMQIERLFKVVATDPEMQNAAAKDVRASFYKRATMDSITEITAEDVQIDKSSGSLVLSASYVVKIPVAGNASLILEFNPTSAK